MRLRVIIITLCIIGGAGIGIIFSLPYFSLANNTSDVQKEADALANAYTGDIETESGADIIKIISDTKTLLAQKNIKKGDLLRAKKRLDLAVNAFYRKNLRKIAENLGIKNGLVTYKKAFDRVAENELKAEVSTRFRDVLEKKILAEENIQVESLLFKAYVYVASQTTGKTSSIGSIPKETLRQIILAEKKKTFSGELLLNDVSFRETFQEIGLYPWSETDLRIMRKAIAIEGLSDETKYVRAYVTAWKYFGNSQKETRLYLKEELKHEKQKQPLSCEANSLSDYLNFYRLREKKDRITEDLVFSLLPKDERPVELRKENGKFVRIWGDPNTSFVGKSDGKQSINTNVLTGYGIHPKGTLPLIQDELGKYGYGVKISELTAFNVLWSIYSGEPVLFWYVLSDDPKKGFAKLDWTTWDGQSRTGYVGEHTGVIVGADVSKTGDLLRIGYYEGTSETIHWDNADELLKKASYFNEGIFAVQK